MSNRVTSLAIKLELVRAGKCQKDVAEWLGYDRSGITKRMQGRVEWRLSELRAIADRLGVPVSRLVDEPESSTEAVAR